MCEADSGVVSAAQNHNPRHAWKNKGNGSFLLSSVLLHVLPCTVLNTVTGTPKGSDFFVLLM